MNIFVDENIPQMVVRTLREMGHDVLDIRGTPEEGIPDDILWKKVQHEGRLLITTDRGFAQQRGQPHHGILIVRLRHPNRRKIYQRVMQAITQFKEEEWSDLLVVMRDNVQSVWRSHNKGE